MVQREHDAEGHAAGPRTGAETRRADAVDGLDQRIPDRGSRDGPGEGRFRGCLRRSCAAVRSLPMTTATDRSESPMEVTSEKWLQMFRRMQMIRHFEEHVNDLYRRALMPGLAHLYSGEEAVAVGICEALQQDDYITSTHRGHGHCLAKGASPDRMFAELLGKEAGYCRGKGGSMHIADPATGNLGANAIVGGSVGIATGAAFASKRLENERVAVCFFGEGALGQGSLYEVMNLAQLWKLPVIFCCENNGYNEYTHFSESTAGDVTKRAEAFGIRHETVDGQNVRQVFRTSSELINRAREGDGPAFLQCITYRYHGHHVGDIARTYYRPKAEEQEWVTQRDPITLHGEWLMENKIATREQLDKIQDDLIKEMDAAMEWAIAASYPDPSRVTEDVYA